jgi:hypothetical protein
VPHVVKRPYRRGHQVKRRSKALPPRLGLLGTCPNKCHECTAKTHASADEMHDIHRPNSGEARASEHADKAEETKGGENEDDSTRLAG